MTSYKSIRLVSFLGTTPYEETTYCWEGHHPSEIRTRYIADAIVQILRPDEIIILGTVDAWNKNGGGIREQLQLSSLRCPPDVPYLPKGESPYQLWEQFETVKQAIRSGPDTSVVLDITHGFRSQPFFAAAAVTFVRSVDPSPCEIQVVYGGALNSVNDAFTPIWDITPFIELLDWSRNLMLFLRTGRAESLATAIEELGRSFKRTWALQGKAGSAPSIDKLGKALMDFGSDLETVRTGSLMIGGRKKAGSARVLSSELLQCEKSIKQAIPPIADVLQRIHEMVDPLITTARLSEPDGLSALRCLANLYLGMGRYAEAAATMREAFINSHADSRADGPGQKEYSAEHRDAAENRWLNANEMLAKDIAQVRNDIEHAGYCAHPMSAQKIKRRIASLICHLGV